MASPFSTLVTGQGNTGGAAGVFVRTNVGILTPYVHGQILSFRMSWFAGGGLGYPNRIRIYTGNAAGLQKVLFDQYSIERFLFLGAAASGDNGQFIFTNGLGNGLPIVSGLDQDIWICASNSISLDISFEIGVWIP